MSCGDHTGPVPLGGIKGFNQVFPFLQSISEGKNNTWVDIPLLPNSLWYSGRNSSTQNAFLQVERQRNEVKPRGKPNQTVPPSRPGFGGWSQSFFLSLFSQSPSYTAFCHRRRKEIKCFVLSPKNLGTTSSFCPVHGQAFTRAPVCGRTGHILKASEWNLKIWSVQTLQSLPPRSVI